MSKTSSTSSESQLDKVAEEVDDKVRSWNRNGNMKFLAKSKKPADLSNNIGVTRPNFLTVNAKKTFNCLYQAFIKASILWNFNPEYYIQIEVDTLDYIIDDIFKSTDFR